MKKNLFVLWMTLSLPPGISHAASLWWSETMPHAEHGTSQHSHGGPVEIRRGIYHKNLWLRAGDGPVDSSYLDQAVPGKVFLLDAKGEMSEVKAGNVHGSYGINFAMPDEGFYNLYLVNENVTDSVRNIIVAKSESLKHSCREGHDHVKNLIQPNHLDDIPLEIVRERSDDENFHSLIGFGDTVRFLVLRNGKPQAGASVTIHTTHGWRNTVSTDDSGHASFMMIRDYYPPWHEFERRHRQDYVVQAVYTANDAGGSGQLEYRKTRYEATLNGSYYPSPRDYRSYAYGLLLGTFALVFTGVAVYLYRRRRQHRFQEIRFDEKA
ncbi:MAG: hypothetical protein AB1450_00290 [Pseudomonadota bacterium]